jgi:type I restriction enzyme S subunit
MKSYMLNHSSGGTRKAITKGHILSFPLPLPPLREQAGIVETLEMIDAKLASNRAVIGHIPEVIRACLDEALLSDSVTVPVSSLATFINGGAYTKNASGDGRMVIRIADLNSGPGASTVYNNISVPDNKTARAGDILMSWSGSLGVYRWFRDEAIINQHIFKVLPKSLPAWLVFDRLEHVLDIFRGIAKDKATTMGHIQRGHLESTHVDLPNSSAIESLDVALAPLWSRLLVAEQESLQLVRLRDALLPELLAGQVRVPEAAGALG